MDCRFCEKDMLYAWDQKVVISFGNEQAQSVEDDRGRGLATFFKCEHCDITILVTLTIGQMDMQKAGIRVLFEEGYESNTRG